MVVRPSTGPLLLPPMPAPPIARNPPRCYARARSVVTEFGIQRAQIRQGIMPSPLLIFAAAATGASAGLIGGVFGIGGGAIAIPLFGFLFGLDQRVPPRATLVMVAPNVLLAF